MINIKNRDPNKIKIDKSFVDTSKKLLKNRNQNFAVFCHFTWKLEFVSNILWMIVITDKINGYIKQK